jgi:hypothetical protein
VGPEVFLLKELRRKGEAIIGIRGGQRNSQAAASEKDIDEERMLHRCHDFSVTQAPAVWSGS